MSTLSNKSALNNVGVTKYCYYTKDDIRLRILPTPFIKPRRLLQVNYCIKSLTHHIILAFILRFLALILF
jgi:hypothetical protein